jgi:hypothetical protein
MWRVWNEKGVPLHELKYEWTYRELLEANAVLDMYQSFEIANDAYTEKEMKMPGGK